MHRFNIRSSGTALAFAFGLLALPRLAGATTWELDVSHSRVGFAIRHLMISDVRGDFRKFSGKKRKPTRRVGMTPNEVAYVLNLKSMADSPDSRKAQFAMLTSRLDRELDRFVRKTGRTSNLPKPSRAASDINVHACLQVADLIRSEVPSDEIKLLVPYLALLVPPTSKPLPGQRVASNTSGVNTRYVDLRDRAVNLIDEREYIKLFLPLGREKLAQKTGIRLSTMMPMTTKP